MTKRITLLKPGGHAWLVGHIDPVPEAFKADLAAGAIADIPDETGNERSHIRVATFAGAVNVKVGEYLIKTDNGQVFGMTPEQFPEVWKVVEEPLPGDAM